MADRTVGRGTCEDCGRVEEFIERSRAADSHLFAVYWDLRFIAHVTREVAVETPRLLRNDVGRARAFLTGNAESIGSDCGIGGCEREAAAYLSGDRPYPMRRPLCERHYLAVKGGAMALIALLIVAFVASVAWLGVVLP